MVTNKCIIDAINGVESLCKIHMHLGNDVSNLKPCILSCNAIRKYLLRHEYSTTGVFDMHDEMHTSTT